METFVSNFVDSSFKHELHSYDLCLILTYEYEIDNFIFDFTSYWIINYHFFK